MKTAFVSFVLATVISSVATVALAQQQPANTFDPAFIYASTAFPGAVVQQPSPSNSAAAAWSRQWGPIQDVTGISPSQARNFLGRVANRAIADSQRTMADTADLGLIAADVAVVPTLVTMGQNLYQGMAQGVVNATANTPIPAWVQAIRQAYDTRGVYIVE